eukprot:Gregarina_sp_Poly_1__10680@NODE_807_length_6221_cov_56_782580_g588_i0_p4_GENE_NODE_807_length_6221_cov_56_782580_g588_i0NODE_807_length_6221_cov_56_782580_g588_i0_p4_ORF_typecomplete_len130_score22_50Destabilase/PF05497_12/0_032zfRING_2/PF13639_6/0_35_NODE_807_length_6221_cov_56_782580_g588_i057966185
MSCKICWEDLDDDLKVQFTTDLEVTANTNWKDCLFCHDCVQLLIQTQFDKFMHDAVNVDCERTMRRLMERGPPIWVHDDNGFPDTNNMEVPWLKRMQTQEIFSGKLKGAKEGEARDALWKELKSFVAKH